MSVLSVIIEADGGSRGNPGPSAYGAVLRDAATGAVIAEDARTLGVATNNVAEYEGLIAGLRLAEEFAPGAEIEVHMDSKLVVEQMSGRWKIKHKDMQALAMTAHGLAPFGTTYVWIPRAQNSHADRLANEALDGVRAGVTIGGETVSDLLELADELPTNSPGFRQAQPTTSVPPATSVQPTTGVPPATSADPGAGNEGYRGWSPPAAARVTLVLVRHGVTELTRDKRFSGGLAASNPSLTDLGRDQALATAGWLAAGHDRFDALVASPVARAWETAQIVGTAVGLTPQAVPGLSEMEFGQWDGLTYADVADQFPHDLAAWLGSVDHRPGGGESLSQVGARVDRVVDQLVEAHADQTVLVVSHVTPIKHLVRRALGDVSAEVLYRMELRPASVSVVTFLLDEQAAITGGSLRLFNALPQDRFSLGV